MTVEAALRLPGMEHFPGAYFAVIPEGVWQKLMTDKPRRKHKARVK